MSTRYELTVQNADFSLGKLNQELEYADESVNRISMTSLCAELRSQIGWVCGEEEP
jgi:hypothetical protein